MSESQGRDLKPPEDGMFYENFGFGTFFGIIIFNTKLMHGNPLCNYNLDASNRLLLQQREG